MKKVLALSLFLVASATGEKSLVFLAGPRRSESETMEKFFHDYATGDTDPFTDFSNGLEGWIWPQVEEDLPGEKHEYFENFFWNHHNSTIQQILMDSIHDAWGSADKGVILGADGFDNTRGDPNSLGLKKMNHIVKMLNVNHKNVHVVISYRAPRLNQWIGLYQQNGNGDGSYDDFVCKEKYAEHLANIPMNPLMLATVYRKQGFNVSVIDLSGVQNKNFNAAHVVACNVLTDTHCDNGWVIDIDSTVPDEEQYDHLSSFDGLTTAQKKALEGLFMDRDCCFKEALEADESFSVIQQHTIWQDCAASEEAKCQYDQLVDDKYFFDLVKAQKSCSSDPVPLDEITKTVEEQIDMDGPSSLQSRMQILVAFIVVIFAFVTWHLIGRWKRGQTHYVKSPRSGHDVWIDFAEDAVGEENLRGASDDDGDFSEVDLKSPRFRKSDLNSSIMLKTPPMAAAAKEGRSVRNVYRVGMCQDSQGSLSTKHQPQKGDSQFEVKIKNLEQELV